MFKDRKPLHVVASLERLAIKSSAYRVRSSYLHMVKWIGFGVICMLLADTEAWKV